MTRIIKETNAFRRDLKRAEKRGKDMAKLFAIVESLVVGKPLEPRHRPHRLTGDWRPCWECHIEPDWLLIYQVHDDYVELIRTGTHSDLFRYIKQAYPEKISGLQGYARTLVFTLYTPRRI